MELLVATIATLIDASTRRKYTAAAHDSFSINTHSPYCPEISSKGLILYVAEVVVLLYAVTIFVGATLEVMPRPTKTTVANNKCYHATVGKIIIALQKSNQTITFNLEPSGYYLQHNQNHSVFIQVSSCTENTVGQHKELEDHRLQLISRST